MKTLKIIPSFLDCLSASAQLDSLSNLGGYFFMEEEIWKDIPGYEGIYQASTEGRIKSLYREVPHPKTIIQRVRETILIPSDNGTGYLRVILSIGAIQKRLYVHRLILLTYKGESDLDGDHINGIRHDNRLVNLQYLTARQNQHKRILNRSLPIGVYKRGNKYRAKIYINGVLFNLGTFESVELANSAYQNKLNSL